MSAEYLSPQDARDLKLPIFNRAARIRKIREVAGVLAAGRESYFGDTQINTRLGLIILAERREALDRQLEIMTPVAEKIARFTGEIHESHETVEVVRMGFSDVISQPILFETEGE